MSESLLTVQGLRFRYPASDWELTPIDLELRRGELLGVVGPNGSGKSTLLRLAAGQLTPAGGTILLKGEDLLRTPRRDIARLLGYLPQGVRPAYDHTVTEVVEMGRFCRQRGLGFGHPEDRKVVIRARPPIKRRARSR